VNGGNEFLLGTPEPASAGTKAARRGIKGQKQERKKMKNITTMKKIVTSSIVLIIALVAVIIAPTTRAGVVPKPAGALALVGVWNAQVTLTPCVGTPPPFGARHIFNADGTFVSTDNQPLTLNPPAYHNGPAFGTWQYMGGRTFTAYFEFYFFNPDGTWAGTAKIGLTITLAADGNSFHADIKSQRYDTTGNLVGKGTGSEDDTRQEPEDLDVSCN
jgi:hypothetical protein